MSRFGMGLFSVRAGGRFVSFLAGLVMVASAPGCRSQTGASAPPPESAAACAERQRNFTEFVSSLPSRAVASPTRVDLPLSTVGASPGSGRSVEIGADQIVFDGEVVRDGDAPARVRRFEEWVKSWPKGERPVLYVAAAANLEMQTLRSFLVRLPEGVEPRLLVRTVVPEKFSPSADASTEGQELAAKLLGEPDPQRRGQIAAEGYSRFADCASVASAVGSVSSLDSRQRWPALQAALGKALPECQCGKLDTTSLRLLVSAEQRAGAATLGWLPLGFLHDERCDASMPLRSVQKLVKQIEAFDEEFAGDFARDAVQFGDVVVSDRLRVYFCNALPGETLAAKERARATLYFRAPGAATCEAFRFAPSSPGAPTGTFARANAARPPIAFHYWQAAEEIRIFGPIDPASPSKPTDEREWPCEDTFRLTGIDDDAIVLENGRWFFEESACLKAPEATAKVPGCVARRASGAE